MPWLPVWLEIGLRRCGNCLHAWVIAHDRIGGKRSARRYGKFTLALNPRPYLHTQCSLAYITLCRLRSRGMVTNDCERLLTGRAITVENWRVLIGRPVKS